MIILAKCVIIFFGLFIIGVGILILFSPGKARDYLRKAGSNFWINYLEISIRMIPATALVLFADHSKSPELFKLLGWFMLATSMVLFFIPQNRHHAYALWCADRLKPVYIKWIAPFALLFGAAILYSVI